MLRSWVLRTLSYFKTKRLEGELNEEIEAHLELATADLMDRGLSEPSARLQALRDFGGLELTRERYRDQRGLPMLDTWLQDLRIATRRLRRSPVAVLVSVLLLAVGIGATTIAYSVVDSVLLQSLPVPEPEKLVSIRETVNGQPTGGNPARLRDLQDHIDSLIHIAGYFGEQPVLLGRGEPRRVSTLRTLGPYLETIGLTPLAGRSFTAEEAIGQGADVTVLTYEFWKREFGVASALNQRLQVGEQSLTVIGVLPQIELLQGIDMLAPAHQQHQDAGRVPRYLDIVARLAPEQDLEASQSEVDVLMASLEQQFPDSDVGVGAQLVPMHQALTNGARVPLWGLLSLAMIVFALTCLNLAGVTLTRASERERESALRIALGAGTWRLLRLHLVESAVIVSIGGLLGFAFAWATLQLLASKAGSLLPLMRPLAIHPRVALVGGLLAAGAVIALSLGPALLSSRRGTATGLRGGFALSAGPARQRFQRALVGIQVALSMVLLIGTALLTRSLFEAQQLPLGFEPGGVLVLRTEFSWDTENATLHDFAERGLESLKGVPGVEAVGLVDRLPLQGGSQSSPVLVQGRELSPALASGSVAIRAVGGEAHEVLRVPLLEGTALVDATQDSDVVVNRAFARAYFDGMRPLGQRISFKGAQGNGGEEPEWLTIIGVIGDVRQEASMPAVPEVFGSYKGTFWPYLHFIVRTSSNPRQLVSSTRDALQAVTGTQVIDEVLPLTEELTSIGALPRRAMWVLHSFSILALLLTAVGLYGLVAADVTQRLPEFGLRVALGARPPEIALAALRGTMKVAIVGAVFGLVIGVVCARAAQDLLWAVTPYDPVALALAALCLVTVAGGSALVPGLKAARVDPNTALRSE